MSTAVVIVLCALVLIGYLFDVTSSKTRIPSVILLLLLGAIVKMLLSALGVVLPDLQQVLPPLGTVGLLLIVLEGSLELELDRSKRSLVVRSLLMAVVPMLLVSLAFAVVLAHWWHVPFSTALVNVLPLCVISSAIAIPTARRLSPPLREFITFESSFSDIVGVLLFNFFALNEMLNAESVLVFSADVLLMVLVSFIATAALAWMLHRIRHSVKFVPIVVTIILVYFSAKAFHLPALLFIMALGLFLGNVRKFEVFGIIRKLHPEALSKEIHRLQELVGESAFLIRVLFFLLFGFLMKPEEIMDTKALYWSCTIVVGIFIARIIFLLLTKAPVFPLLFIAPRGLITVLLFLSIPAARQINYINSAVVIQVVVMTALIMMFGMLFYSNKSTVKV